MGLSVPELGGKEMLADMAGFTLGSAESSIGGLWEPQVSAARRGWERGRASPAPKQAVWLVLSLVEIHG